MPNPTDHNVESAMEVYNGGKCHSLISIGSSSRDCAKGVCFVAANNGRIHDYEGVDKSSRPRRQYYRWYRFGNDPLLHHHRHLPQG